MDIDGIVEYAKNAFLALGDYPPCFFVDYATVGYVCVALPQFETAPNALERARISFFGGRKFGQTTAKQFKGHKVTGVCSVAKVWYTMTLADQVKDIPYVKPSLSPRRKEGFSINTLDADTMEQDQILYEILRDGLGKLTDLFKDPEIKRAGPVQGAWLPCFLAGMRSCEQHRSLATHEFRRTFERYAPPLPYEMG